MIVAPHRAPYYATSPGYVSPQAVGNVSRPTLTSSNPTAAMVMPRYPGAASATSIQGAITLPATTMRTTIGGQVAGPYPCVAPRMVTPQATPVGIAPRMAAPEPGSAGSAAEICTGLAFQYMQPNFRLQCKEQNDRFLRTLRMVQKTGFFSSLQPDQDGTLHINVPLCGCMMEAPALARFILDDLLPSLKTVQRVHVHCADPKMTGIQMCIDMIPEDPRLQFDTSEADLSSVAQSPASLAIGLHPQPLPKTPDQKWERIIENVLSKSSKCLFTTWMDHEAKELVAMCERFGAKCSVQLNPWRIQELQEGYSMRFHFVVLADR